MAELKEIQALIVKTRAERGFTTEPLKIFMLLNEEIGEILTVRSFFSVKTRNEKDYFGRFINQYFKSHNYSIRLSGKLGN